MQTTLILGSSSPYRKALLQRLCVDYQTFSPDIDETRLVDETAEQMVLRLSLQKAQAIAKQHPNALIIGSDQCAVLNGDILGKPHTHENAIKQLQASSGQQVSFLTGLCLYDSRTDEYQLDLVLSGIEFRDLTTEEIDAYLRNEKPYNCAGSFKSEGLGVSLFKGFTGSDPSALMGLPLIRLCDMLRNIGVNLPQHASVLSQ
jgi:septum formation protein